MQTTADSWGVIDNALNAQEAGAPTSRRWLLTQTLATSVSRRALLGSLPIPPGARLIDLGCGFGAGTLELSALRPTTAFGIDIDRPVLEVASEVAREVEGKGGLAPGSTVSFLTGDAYHLPFPDGHFDALVSRFVFQHLADSAAAATEISRVIRPGGMVCVVDVDDALSISEPAPSEGFTRLAAALRATQASFSGDRFIGRKLAALLDTHGLTPSAVLVIPQAAYSRTGPDDPQRRLLVERLTAARPSIVAARHISAEQFDADLAEVAAEQPGPTCEIEAHIAVVALRRP